MTPAVVRGFELVVCSKGSVLLRPRLGLQDPVRVRPSPLLEAPVPGGVSGGVEAGWSSDWPGDQEAGPGVSGSVLQQKLQGLLLHRGSSVPLHSRPSQAGLPAVISTTPQVLNGALDH